MVRRLNKKGSLNLSIQAIVVVVIAFVVLGLGLGFVRSQFGTIEETAGSVQEQIKQQILDDLRTGNKKLSFPATSLTVERGQAKDIAVGIKNTGNTNLNYRVDVSVLSKQGSSLTTTELEGEVDFFYDPGVSTLSQTESRVHSIRITAPGSTGTYLVKLSVIDEDDLTQSYDDKTFFVTII